MRIHIFLSLILVISADDNAAKKSLEATGAKAAATADAITDAYIDDNAERETGEARV